MFIFTCILIVRYTWCQQRHQRIGNLVRKCHWFKRVGKVNIWASVQMQMESQQKRIHLKHSIWGLLQGNFNEAMIKSREKRKDSSSVCTKWELLKTIAIIVIWTTNYKVVIKCQSCAQWRQSSQIWDPQTALQEFTFITKTSGLFWPLF